MRVPSRYAVAIHTLALLGTKCQQVATSEWIAGSAGVNPVVVRQVTGLLRRAGLVRVSQGVAGASLSRPLDQITLLDVYRAVGVDDGLFGVHPHPHPACPVGRHIQETLESVFGEAQQAMERQLAATTMADIVGRLEAAATSAQD